MSVTLTNRYKKEKWLCYSWGMLAGSPSWVVTLATQREMIHLSTETVTQSIWLLVRMKVEAVAELRGGGQGEMWREGRIQS